MKTRLFLYILFVFLFTGHLFPQAPPATIIKENYTLNSGQSQMYTAIQSITLKPTTWIKSGSTFSAVIVPDAYTPVTLSSDRNYILTRSYQKAMTSSAGITENKDVIDQVMYYDGLGRPMQQVAIKASPDLQDIITTIEYDAFGRQPREYLPYTSSQQGGAFNANALSETESFYATPKYENTPNPYSEQIFESSPLNRVMEVGAPGADWLADPDSDEDHTIKYEYTTNGTNEVRLYRVSLTTGFIPSLVASGYYAPGELYVTVTKDENWQPADGDNHTIKEYTDKQGRVVLKRTYNGAAHDTYYVYDDYGNPTYVIPPKVNTSDGVSATELDELCYQYQYDERNRLVEKKVPGKGWEYIVYNMLDQPVLTQDAHLDAQDKWLFTKYDAFGRVTYTGTVNSSSSRTTLQNSANNTTAYDQYEVRTPTANTYGGTPVYYSNNAAPKTLNDQILTINYYDDYDFDKDGLTVPVTVLGQTVDLRTKTLATGSKTRVLGTNHWITTIYAYDQKGRLIYTASTNPYLNTTDIVEHELDFPGKILQTQTTHAKGSNPAIVTVDEFEYDHMGRLLTQTQKINSQAEELIAENSYDDLGQLEQKKVGNSSANPLQEVDYRYNVRGWLTDINDVDNPGDHLFNFQINYNSSRSGVVDPLYNGNIAETYWKTGNDNTLRRYAYSYDALNRITSGLYNNSGSSESNRYSVQGIAYDKNGNIEALTRRGHLNSGATSFGIMDDLSYAYDTGNKLLKVTDTGNTTYGFKDGSNTGNDYTYDGNGNLLTDANKGITGTTYNHLNLPEQINFGSDKIVYIYDASGVKLKKEVTEGSSVTDIEYANGYIYENSSLAFFSHPEGYVTKENNSFKYVYQYKDHLGNVRLSYANTGTTSVPQLEIVQENNYYPFGVKHQGYNGGISSLGNSVAQKWKFNGQEYNESFGLNTIEMTFRQYDPATGRFNVIDAASELAQNWTSYRFGFNNPVLFSDPLGLWEIRNGNWYTDDKDDIQRFLNMISMEDAFNGGASIAQIDKFIGEEFRGSGGRLSDGSILLDEESVAIDKSGKASDLSPRQADHIQNQISTYGSHWWNEKSSSYNNPWYTYKYYRERSWQQNGGSFPGIALGSYAAGQVSKFLYSNEGWYSLAQAKRYGHGFHGNQFTERRVTIGNLSKWVNTGGKMLGAYGVYATYDEWKQGKLTNLGAAYMGGVDAAALRYKNPYLAAWSVGTGLGKGVVESDWYFNAVHNAPNW